MDILKHLQQILPSPDVADALKSIGENIGTKAQIDRVCRSVNGYLEAQTYDNISAIPNGSVTVVNYVTLLEARQGKYGHWVCIDNRPVDRVLYLDPYGLGPDIARAALHLNHGNNLRAKLAASVGGKSIYINRTQFQDFAPSDDSCAAWSSLFVVEPYDPAKPVYQVSTPSANRDLQLEERLEGGSI